MLHVNKHKREMQLHEVQEGHGTTQFTISHLPVTTETKKSTQ
jgi:hypothetical protein